MNAREVALKVINEINVNQAYANIALARELGHRNLSNQDRRFATELVYGTVKAGATLDWILGHYISRPLHKISPVILDILRMGLYQIFFLSRVPESAACNQAVEQAKKYGHPGTVKFVNAVLRNACRESDKVVYPDRGKEPARYLSLKYFHPQWLVDRWMRRMGPEETEKLCQCNNMTPPLAVRTNTLKTSRDHLLEVLAGEEVVCTPSAFAPEGIICREYPSLPSLRSLQQGLFQIQDEGSMLVAHVLSPQPNEFVIDACGAPGGKSTHIAALMNNKGKVLCTDIYKHKLQLVHENCSRLGIDILETKVLDATTIGNFYTDQADRVLVDAPCSGLGVLRRKPDSRWRKSEAMLRDLPKLQSAILHSAADCVKPGGILVYSTCTIEPEENEDVVRSFLESRRDFSLQPVGDHLPRKSADKMLQLFPHSDGVDGFFIARLIRKSR
jgi:16S rRNA (cytosine967-C5)-methyltransferase